MIKIVEVFANSTKSWSHAAKQALKKVSESRLPIHSVYIKELRTTHEDDVTQYHVVAKISLETVNASA